jgi:hypothetical protein
MVWDLRYLVFFFIVLLHELSGDTGPALWPSEGNECTVLFHDLLEDRKASLHVLIHDKLKDRKAPLHVSLRSRQRKRQEGPLN